LVSTSPPRDGIVSRDLISNVSVSTAKALFTS